MSSKEYEGFVSDLLSSIAEMRLAGGYDENTLEALEWRFSAPSNRVVCPNGEGDPFACEPFCALCEGSGEVEAGCDEYRREVVACPCGVVGCKAVLCLDCDDVLSKDCEGF